MTDEEKIYTGEWKKEKDELSKRISKLEFVAGSMKKMENDLNVEIDEFNEIGFDMYKQDRRIQKLEKEKEKQNRKIEKLEEQMFDVINQLEDLRVNLAELIVKVKSIN